MEGNIDKSRLIWPGLAGLYDSIAPYSYAIIRFTAGAIIIYHGYAKLILGFAPAVAKNILIPMGFPMPEVLAYWLGVLELFGGAALAVGLLTRPIALLLVIEFVIITFGWNFRFGYFFSAQGGGYEFPLLLLLLYFAIFFRGAGRCSLDRMIGKEF
jgi:putative oxidoreductase